MNRPLSRSTLALGICALVLATISDSRSTWAAWSAGQPASLSPPALLEVGGKKDFEKRMRTVRGPSAAAAEMHEAEEKEIPTAVSPNPPAAAAPSAAPRESAAPSGGSRLPGLEPIDSRYVARRVANVRSEPGVTAPVVARLDAGERVLVLGRLSGTDWYLVSRGDGPLGYVVADQLAPDAAGLTAAASGPVSIETAHKTAPALLAGLSDVKFGRYHALVIGNNAYRAVPRLETAVSDAKAIGAVLRELYGFEVTVLTDATRADVLGALAGLRGRLGWEDNLLIYYAGHGVYDEASERGYWLPVDAARDNPANWISNADVTDMLKALRAKHVLVVADSCYSGTLTRSAAVALPDADYLKRIAEKKARTVLTSGGFEPVADGGGGGHSVFARALLEALRANPGALDGQSLFNQIREPVVLNAPQTPEYSNLRFAGHEGGDFVFVRR